MDRDIRTVEDVLRLLDGLFADTDAARWDRFYADQAREAGVTVDFRCGDAFAATGPYDLIYDSGCFHHLPPRRCVSFSDLEQVELRLMMEQHADSPWFGVPFLWTALFRR